MLDDTLEINWKDFGNDLPKNFQVNFVVLYGDKNQLKVHNRLITESFKKAKHQEEEQGNTNPSKSGLATVLSDYIEVNQDFQFSERRLRDYYNGTLADRQIEIKQTTVLNGLSSFLGYSDYTDFVIRNKENKKDLVQNKSEGEITYNLRIVDFIKHHRVSLSIAVISILVIAFLIVSNQQRWMSWDGNNYVEATFDADKLSKGELKAYKKDRIANFTLLQPQCDTQFFNADGGVRVWYSKNKNGNLDFFSSYGLHPVTGKTLKPITKYIIEKYICER